MVYEMTIFSRNYFSGLTGSWLLPAFVSGAVLLVGLGISGGLCWQAKQQDADSLRAAFESAADMAIDNINDRFNVYAVVMRGVRGFFNSSVAISFNEFHTYVQALHLYEKSGVQAIGLVMLVSNAEKARHIQAMRQQKSADYQIKPDGQRDYYAPIIYIEPFAGDNLKAFGFDPLTVPAALSAMAQARDADDIRTTSRIALIQDADKPYVYSFVMYLPLYKKGAEFATLAQRRAAIIGWVDVPFRINDLMAGIRRQLPTDISLEIYDGITLSEQTRLFQSGINLGEKGRVADGLQTSRSIMVGGRQWVVRMVAAPAFENRAIYRYRPELVFATSVTLTLLLTLLTWQLARSRQTAEIHFRQLFRQAGEGILILNDDHLILDANNTALALLGYSRAELLSLHLPAILATVENVSLSALAGMAESCAVSLEQWRYRCKNGTEFPSEVSVRRLDGQRYFAILRDRTERQKAEQRILRLTQLYQALSETNQAIVRMDNARELFPLVCRCAVAFGGMKMAWIGQLNEADLVIVPVAAYGVGQEYLDGLVISASADVAEGLGPTGTALRENRPVIINDYLNNPMTIHWHERAKRFAWAAAGTFPIRRNGKPFAVLTVYHNQINAFDTEAIELLKEMACDITFALDNFDRDVQRQAAQKALAENEAKLSLIMENVSAYIYLKDREGRYLYVNRPCLELWGLTMADVIGVTDEVLFDHQLAAKIRADDRHLFMTGEILRGEETGTATKTGKTATYWAVKMPLRHTDGSIYALCGISTDITERKQIEAQLQQQLKELRQWFDITLGREERVMQLKTEINKLLGRLGEPPRYADPASDLEA
jgi:PAS domain S-box-containing protein